VAYIERKKISGKTYYYLTTTKRVGGKFKKTRKYIGTRPHAKTFAQAKKIAAKMAKNEILAIETIRKNYAARHPLDKSLWKEEKERLVSFVYNTNAIEGNTLTVEETEKVLAGDKEIPKRKEKDAREVLNMKKCVDFLFDFKGEISQGMVLKLHLIEQEGIMQDAGKYRNVDVRVGKYICPAWQDVPKLMEEFVSWYLAAKGKLHPFELSCLAHLKFVRVHPFRDGNGRMARLLANFILLKNGYPLLNIFNDEKMLYYLMLQKYDSERKERPFVRYLVEVFVGQYMEYWKK